MAAKPNAQLALIPKPAERAPSGIHSVPVVLESVYYGSRGSVMDPITADGASPAGAKIKKNPDGSANILLYPESASAGNTLASLVWTSNPLPKNFRATMTVTVEAQLSAEKNAWESFWLTFHPEGEAKRAMGSNDSLDKMEYLMFRLPHRERGQAYNRPMFGRLIDGQEQRKDWKESPKKPGTSIKIGEPFQVIAEVTELNDGKKHLVVYVQRPGQKETVAYEHTFQGGPHDTLHTGSLGFYGEDAKVRIHLQAIEDLDPSSRPAVASTDLRSVPVRLASNL